MGSYSPRDGQQRENGEPRRSSGEEWGAPVGSGDVKHVKYKKEPIVGVNTTSQEVPEVGLSSEFRDVYVYPGKTTGVRKKRRQYTDPTYNQKKTGVRKKRRQHTDPT